MQNLRWAIGRWWFWVGVVLFIALAVYFKGYLDWYLAGAKYRDINANAQAYIVAQEAQQAALEAQYKNDPYGGATPEETLKLFIEALEKKDYTLASNYFIPEKRKEELRMLPEAVKSGGVTGIISAYREGQVKQTKYTGEDKFEFRLYEPGSTAPFILTIIKNPFNNKWLISEL